MAAGVFGYLGYDTIRLVENLPGVNPDDLGVPDSMLMRPTLVVIFDSVKDEMTVVTPVRPDPRVPAAKALGQQAFGEHALARLAAPSTPVHERWRFPKPRPRRSARPAANADGGGADGSA